MDGLQNRPDDTGPELAAGGEQEPRLSTDGVLSTEYDDAAGRLQSLLAEGVERTSVTNMTEPLGKGVHGHGPRKYGHDLRSAFSVNPEIITTEFEAGVLPNGHEALTYMAANKERLIDSEIDVFTDTRDDDESRWEMIELVKEHAPISPRRESEIFADAHSS